jgi:tetratricopeptide (TPR) repeat protein
MLRCLSRSVFPVAVCVLVLARFSNAQSADNTWKDLIVKASYSAEANDYAKAEQTYLQALHEAERFGADDARVGTTLNDLGQIYRKEKKFAEAESAYRRASSILETTAGAESTDIADVNFNIAVLMFDQGRQSMALPYLHKTLTTWEVRLGGDDVRIAAALCMVGDAYRLEKDFRAAEDPLRRCADIREKEGGVQNADLAEAMHSLALVYEGEGKLQLADPRFKLAEKIEESTLGITSPLLAQTMEEHAILLRQMGRTNEAARLDLIAGAIRRHQRK